MRCTSSAPVALRNCVENGLPAAAVAGIDSDFQQLVVRQGQFDFAQYGRGQALVADDDHRFALVREAAQMPLLFFT